MVGSLSGVVASKSVTGASTGALSTNGVMIWTLSQP